MSRSMYSDDCDDNWGLIRWRGAVASAIRGKRGQQALMELRDAMDFMPVKELAAESLITADGQFCTLGVLGKARGISLETLDPNDPDAVASAFGLSDAMVREIAFENDENGPTSYYYRDELPSARWQRMRNWVDDQIKEPV